VVPLVCATISSVSLNYKAPHIQSVEGSFMRVFRRFHRAAMAMCNGVANRRKIAPSEERSTTARDCSVAVGDWFRPVLSEHCLGKRAGKATFKVGLDSDAQVELHAAGSIKVAGSVGTANGSVHVTFEAVAGEEGVKGSCTCPVRSMVISQATYLLPQRRRASDLVVCLLDTPGVTSIVPT